ncbi:MAG TPA: phosphomevalonate kinase [Candidatus Ligilactobacillus excrementigallinarum]|uniref:phosphomevalonate kinase n=1 Tax=Candidatus Ligilactobacillus excrementigallinarum TaxID=2838641 RepID=A0A9D1UX68_9LACO|nr:phosphomevalonate kinase [Candidatus Ligilactobacillus excrementigallinarum]
MIKLKVPGKLYVAGEYAVVENGYPAVLVAINRFIHLTVEPTKYYGTIFSKQYQEKPVRWTRSNSLLRLANSNINLNFVLEAIRITEKYLFENGTSPKYFNLTINSELDSIEGKKYGLGSSAAVTVGVVRAISALYNVQLDSMTVFKLAAVAHYNIQQNGSLGDIAAITFGGWIGYHSVDRDWLTKQSQNSLTKLIDASWKGLKIQSLNPPAILTLLVGWTGKPASTAKLISQVKQTNSKEYHTFLAESKKCVTTLIKAFEKQDVNLIKTQINLNRKILQKLQKLSDVSIETPLLTKLIEIANQHHAAAKTSGAGGGDCGIAILNQASEKQVIYNAWEKAGIEPIALQVYQED